MSIIVLICVSRSCMTDFFFNHTATTEIYTLSLHDALPIYPAFESRMISSRSAFESLSPPKTKVPVRRSEEHTSELQSRVDLVCRLLLEKKKVKDWFRYELHFVHGSDSIVDMLHERDFLSES